MHSSTAVRLQLLPRARSLGRNDEALVLLRLIIFSSCARQHRDLASCEPFNSAAERLAPVQGACCHEARRDAPLRPAPLWPLVLRLIANRRCL